MQEGSNVEQICRESEYGVLTYVCKTLTLSLPCLPRRHSGNDQYLKVPDLKSLRLFPPSPSVACARAVTETVSQPVIIKMHNTESTFFLCFREIRIYCGLQTCHCMHFSARTESTFFVLGRSEYIAVCRRVTVCTFQPVLKAHFLF